MSDKPGISVYKLIGHFKTEEDARKFSRKISKSDDDQGYHKFEREILYGTLYGNIKAVVWNETKKKWVERK